MGPRPQVGAGEAAERPLVGQVRFEGEEPVEAVRLQRLDRLPHLAVPGPGHPAPLAPTADFTRAAIQRLAADLSTAERPLLLAGRGAWLAGAGRALGELAEATGALTATTASAWAKALRSDQLDTR